MHESDLRKALEGEIAEPCVLPLRDLGPADGAAPLFPGGTLQLTRNDGDAAGLRVRGRAPIAICSEPADVRAEFGSTDGEVSGIALAITLPGTGVRASEIARLYGYELPELPAPPVTGLTFRGDAGGFTLALDGLSGDGGILDRDGAQVLVVPAPGGHVLATRSDLTARQVSGLGVPVAVALPAGVWLALPDGTVVPVSAPRTVVPDHSGGTDGLGRPRTGATRVPYAQHPYPGLSPRTRAVPTADGFVVLNAPKFGGPGVSFIPGGLLDGHHGIEVVYDKSPLSVKGALQVQPAQSPYRAVVGGLLTFAFGGGAPGSRGLYGMGTGAVVFPQDAGTRPSFFAFASLGAEPGLGIPAFRLTGVAAGFGWNSRLRTPGLGDLTTFPFLQALHDPSAIGGDDTNPVAVLNTLIGGPSPWITPQQGALWMTAGLAFTIGELIDGTAMAVLQTGADLTIGLLGTAGTSFPKTGDKKYARIEAGLQLVIKPNAGELTVGTSLNPSSYLIDEDCKLRGGVGLTVWYGNHPDRGDFVFSAGGYHDSYHAPAHYPRLPRIGFDWSLGGKVTVSGNAYFALTPRAAMAGGSLDVRYKSGIIKAWCTATVDALIEWKPFYIDVGLSLSIGVEGSVKVLFVRITVRIEVGVSLRIWGPPTGGEARVKVWFVSFTINFGHAARGQGDKTLDWPGTRAMLPEPGARARLRPGDGLISEGTPDNPHQGDWLVKASGFTFGTDTQVPLSRIELATTGADEVVDGSPFGVHPMRATGLNTRQRIQVTLEGQRVDLARWTATAQYTALPPQLWDDTGDPEHGAGQEPHLTGVTLTSPDPDYGTSTGYIGEDTFTIDPVYPEGKVPLKATDAPLTPAPTRPDGVIGQIADGVDTAASRTARTRLHALMGALGLDTEGAKADLPGYARNMTGYFTAEPLLVPAGATRTANVPSAPEGDN
ncbi:DUF6603 domain-containing protein [Streptomyces sp. NPDC060031]|uniref:DUF6603 domain-containing protein n=1 Tax=Streptomyces sp. NPDC060031 TaxID=3347043 RepID=UPI0036BD0E10